MSYVFTARAQVNTQPVLAQQAGEIIEFLLSPNAFVRLGMPLYRLKTLSPEAESRLEGIQKKLTALDPRQLEAQQRQNLARIRGYREKYEAAHRQGAAKSELAQIVEEQTLVEQQVQIVEKKLEKAKRIQQEIAQWQGPEHEVSKSIPSPSAGLIKSCRVAAGSFVTIGQEVCELLQICLKFTMPEPVSWCQPGSELQVQILEPSPLECEGMVLLSAADPGEVLILVSQNAQKLKLAALLKVSIDPK